MVASTVATQTPGGGRTRLLRVLAYASAALVAALAIAGGAFLTLSRTVVYGNDWFLWVLFTLTEAAYVASALAIVRRQPSSAVGWLMFFTAGALAASTAMTAYGIYAITVSPGSLPAPGTVLALAEPTPGLFLMGLLLVLQMFPDGHPVSRRWRLLAWLTVLAWFVVGGLGHLLEPHTITDIWSDELSHAGTSAQDPMGWSALAGVRGVGTSIGTFLAVASSVLSIASLFVRRKRADATIRTQLRWLALVAGTAAGWIVVMLPATVIVGQGPEGQGTWVSALFWLIITPLVALGIPIAVGIAIVRYRLFDIDVVIKKTVVFGVVAGVLLVLYLAVIALATLGTVSRVLIGLVLLLVTFNPVRRAARGLADRIVYGKRATSYEVLTGFSERMGETYATDDVLPRMATILKGGTGALVATVWLNVGAELQPAEIAGEPDDPPRAVPVHGDELPSLAGDLSVEVRHQGELLGALTVWMPPNDPLDPGREKLVRDLASQVGLVLRNVRLIEELRDSRRRLVAAQDEERRKIERNIHDGAQQQLVALAVKQRLAASLVGRDDDRARAMLEELQSETNQALEDLRDLARGIYPPLLADKGLATALEAQARKAALPVTVDAHGVGRLPPEIEAAIYFSCLEALQNAAKYAHASHASIRLATGNGDLRFEVIDDGRGFDPARTSYGTGLQGIVDRLAALGGELEITSAEGAGTTISGRLPA